MFTNYWIIVVDANTLKLATSFANALAGTALDITSAGSVLVAELCGERHAGIRQGRGDPVAGRIS